LKIERVTINGLSQAVAAASDKLSFSKRILENLLEKFI
jgi:hypothetical protein